MEIDLYPLLKWLHILSATVLFGTGLGTAFHMWMAHRSGNVDAIAVAAHNTVRADFIFTTPAVIIQPLTGVLMIVFVGFPWDLPWLIVSYLLYAVAGACWVPVVFLQIKAARMAKVAAENKKPLPDEYFKAMKLWFRLGWPAFFAVFAIFFLMVHRPDLWLFW